MVEIVSAQDHLEQFTALVKEYTGSILAQGDEVAEVLEHQHLDEELEDVERKYAPPSGRMYLAYCDGEPAECAALTRNDDSYCELKRLYVSPRFRNRHIARELMDHAEADAKEIGYKYMRLDTFPFMSGALHLYEKRGFKRIERYNENPASSAVFMEKRL